MLLDFKKRPEKMTRFFDFLYYLIFRFYSSKERGASSSSAGIIGGLQAINILTVLMLISILFCRGKTLNKLIFFLVFVFFQIITYMRYVFNKSHSVQVIEERWVNTSEITKKRIQQFAAVYITFSILLFFGVAIFIGSRK